jgi:hypothetical protein
MALAKSGTSLDADLQSVVVLIQEQHIMEQFMISVR